MSEINKFLNFIKEHLDDDRISISKEIKFGFRYYNISLLLEQESKNKIQNTTFNNSFNELDIQIDNRNKCIVINNFDNSVTIEDEELVKKWSDVFEKHLNQNLEKDIKDILHSTMSGAKDKDLYRDYQMEKIFKKDERI